MKRSKAVALMSGGLDSTLAAKLMLMQNVNVIGVNFAGGYCPVFAGEKTHAEKAAELLGIELVRLPIDAGFVAMVRAPRYNRGRNMNPCVDCHILMIRRAWEYGRTRGADFIVTGEVLGQRPLSQHRQALEVVARRSGTEGMLLRPLSAKCLEPTEPEKTGLVDRERLLDISGRSRKRQMALAQEWGITDYPAPAGGCLLTDAGYAGRLREAFAHGEDSVAVVELLAIGRHFRLPSGARLVVGRDQTENEELRRRTPEGAAVIDATTVPGPLGLLIPDSGPEERRLAAAICARYSDRRGEEVVSVEVGGKEVRVAPAAPEATARLNIDQPQSA
ncbi:MAG: tRNA 4-thiouridine(8) synthase ThiI [candidate division WOR-3 bacterium]